MGAHSVIHQADGKLDKSQLEKHVMDMQENARYEYGNNPYNGTISTMDPGVRILKEEALDIEAASQTVREKHEKWEVPLAVKVKDGPWVFGGWAAS